MSKPKLSVCLITYNHAKYIKESIDSILTQKTNFPWELVIADDFSTDGTREIVVEYQKQNQDLIKLILQKKNVGAEKNWLELIDYPKTEYVIYAEGDDYWTDPNKLQLQFDYMNEHPDCALSFHPVKVFFEGNEEKAYTSPVVKSGYTFTHGDLLKQNFIGTNSVIYRRQKKEELKTGIVPGDWYSHLYHAQFGDIGFINKVMSAYRRHPGGIWWDSYKNSDDIWRKYCLPHMALYNEMMVMYGKDPFYKSVIYESIENVYATLARIDKKYDENLLVQVLSNFPNLAEGILVRQREEIESQKKEIEGYVKEIKTLNSLIRDIRASRVWEVRNRFAKIIGKNVV